jgi:methyl-accepting chemotaxis protein
MNLKDELIELKDKLYSEGNNLIEITKDTVKKSFQDKNDIEEIVKVIRFLENENRNDTENINELVI